MLVLPLLPVFAGAAQAEVAVRCEDIASIGMATMTPDGVITLRLRTLPPDPIAEVTYRYTPGDRDYEAVKNHLGGIVPGQIKSVPPWC